MVKTDCFAYLNDGCNPDCKILTSLVCRSNKTCSFYKSQSKRDEELRQIHGTTDLSEIGAQYAAGHVEKEGENNGK